MKLKILGQEKIGQYEFTGIEGGFGEDKRAMLVRDIAVIHNLETRTVNQTINRNIKRFKTGIDILDLKQITRSDVFSEYGFNKAQWGNANNIYMLSERAMLSCLKSLKTIPHGIFTMSWLTTISTCGRQSRQTTKHWSPTND